MAPPQGTPSVHVMFGALFDGVAISFVLYGIGCAQVVRYFRSYSQDKPLLKLVVGALIVIDTIHAALIVHMLWHYLLEGGLDLFTLFVGNWSLICQVIPVETCVVLVESFFILRMWRLSEHDKLTLIPIIPMLIGFGHGLAYVVLCFKFPIFADYNKTRYVITTCAVSRAITDISIAVTMSYTLRRRGSVLRVSSASLLKALLKWTLTTGLATCIFTVLYLVLFLAMPFNMVYMAAYIVHGKIYTNSMLASLNNRKTLRNIVQRDLNLITRDINLTVFAKPTSKGSDYSNLSATPRTSPIKRVIVHDHRL